MNLEVDMSRVESIMNINIQERIQPVQSIVDTAYSDQINFVVQALVESKVHVPLPEYTRENLSTIVRYVYHNPNKFSSS